MSGDGEQTSRRLEVMHWPEAALSLERRGSTLVWPFGAFEQHGPQLPLLTDALFAERILDKVLEGLPDDLPIWALPTQKIGFSPEHRGFPGTLSLSAELLIGLIREVGKQLAGQGFSAWCYSTPMAVRSVFCRPLPENWPRKHRRWRSCPVSSGVVSPVSRPFCRLMSLPMDCMRGWQKQA